MLRHLCRVAFSLFLLVGFASVQALEVKEARHLLLRAGFGVELFWLQELAPLSRKQAVDKLLNTSRPVFAAPVCAPQTIVPASVRKTWVDADLAAYTKLRGECNNELQERAAASLVESPAVLRERMTLFWHNHFTSALTKVGPTELMYRQHQMLYNQSLGNFRMLLHSVLNDAAMLLYLDNDGNHKNKPNENLARELLELFTLGEGHYSERDIKEVARALTGQSVEREGFTVQFYPARHDFGEKEIFGEKGHFGVEGVVEVILRQPQTAHFITRKLWLEFVSTPHEPTIDKLASQFAKDWNIRALVRSILLSAPFWEDQGQMIKSPVELVVGAERLLPGQQMPAASVTPFLTQLGQQLFNPPNVKGWPQGQDWIDTSRMLLRINFADRLLRGLEQEATPEELAFLCAAPGPVRFAALPGQVTVDENDSCLAQLSSVLTSPVWQLK